MANYDAYPSKIEIKGKTFDLCTLDFETFYSKTYSLRLSAYNTTQYIRSPEFKAHGLGLIYRGSYHWIRHDDIPFTLSCIPWETTAAVMHNALFDAGVLAERYNVFPGFHIDSAAMSRLYWGNGEKHTLDALAKRHQLEGKVRAKNLANTQGIYDLTPELFNALGEYCEDDCMQTLHCFTQMYSGVPDTELKLIDLTTRLFTRSPLVVNIALAKEEEHFQRDRKTMMVSRSQVLKEDLMSNPKFAELLKDLGVDPPMKTSARTGKETYAFASNDPGFVALLEHENPIVAELAEARSIVKSTLHESRAARMIKCGEAGKNLPVGLTYAAAKTHRWGGTNKLNLQNLPRVAYLPNGKPDPNSARLRRAIEAPDGYVIVVSDLSQIEVRVLAWWCGQTDLLDDFAHKVDIYKKMASRIFDRPPELVTKTQRFIGKVCLAHDTPVLTDSGYKPIQEITLSDRLWDGVEWVSHEGIVFNGIKEVITHDSITGTKDHWCVSQSGNPIQIGRAASTLDRFLRTATPDGKTIRVNPNCIPQHPAEKRIPVRRSNLPRVRNNQTDQFRQPTQWKIGEFLRKRSQTFGEQAITTPLRCSPATLQQSEQSYLPLLWRERNSIQLPDSYCDGGICSESIGASYRGNRPHKQRRSLRTGKLALRHTSRASVKFTAVVAPVYDIVNAGPRSCFTAGDGCLVYNCTLGLGYGMGAYKLCVTLTSGAMGQAVLTTQDEAQTYVTLYRNTYPAIPRGWKIAGAMLDAMCYGGSITHQGVTATKNKLSFPNGTIIHYKGIHWDTESENYVYFSKAGRVKIYGALLVENIIQKLARDVIGEQLIAIDETIPEAQIVMTTHDEISVVTKQELADSVLDKLYVCMKQPPAWMPGVPLDAEGGWAKEYSK